MSNINNLSLELVEHIVDYIDRYADLYQCARVSKYFYMASTPKLWYSPIAESNSRNLLLSELLSECNDFENSLSPPRAQDVLPQRGVPLAPLSHCIRKLQFSIQDNVGTIVSVVEQTPLVEDLTIKDHVIDSATMDYIAHLCPQLTRIHLHANTDESGHLASFARHCRHLRHIVLSWPTRLVLNSLAVFKDYRLESLEINMDYRLLPPLENLESFLSGLQNLTSLKVYFNGER
ncbi:hypothetical protein [Absidia glauca]|uniref:Uncharacterized protein n=1 Tax=Absidia glauca TaxID=4829 RepID=A0A163UUC2_ABSGL|nr:hypothetical protein [Absidia glauca]